MLSWFTEMFDSLANILVNVLPVSPFTQFLDDAKNLPYLGYLNWFIPVKDILIVTAAWLGAIALFYLYSIALRWVKMIGD